jgi:hypothetical protein
MSGSLHQKNTSKAFPISSSLVIEMLIPFVLGMLAIITHAKLRMHLGIPGHQGVIFMALLIIARISIKIRWSSLLFSAGVGSMLYIPFLGFGDPYAVFVYLWPGIIFDIFFVSNVSKQQKLWFLTLLGGLAYSSIPFSRFILGIFTGLMHKSLLNGLFIPYLLFFVFGLIGTFIGIGTNHLIKKLRTSDQSSF